VSEPTNQAEYVERFHENARIEGRGHDVRQHVPCPFCAAPDWLVHFIISSQDALEAGGVCHECHRGAKAIITYVANTTLTFELVQTSGPTQPTWLEPQLRDLRQRLN
jgi:hypothetical protein